MECTSFGNIRSLCIKIVLFLVAFHSLHMSTPAIGGDQDQCAIFNLNSIIEIAIRQNPTLKSLRHAVEVEKALIEPSGALPDPTIGIAVLNLPMDTFSLDQEAMTQSQIRLTQKIPYPGKLSLKKDIQALKARAAKWRLEEEILTLKRDVRILYWELFRIKNTLRLLQREKKTLEKIIALTTSKYETGSGLQSDVLLAQLELTRLLDKEIALKAQEEDRLHKLMEILGTNDSCIDVKVPTISGISSIYPLDTLAKEALRQNPGILKLEELLELKKTSYELTKKSYYPDFSVLAAYGKRFGDNPDGSDRTDFGSLMFSFNLPIFYRKKQTLEVVSALEGVKSMGERLDAKRDQVIETLRGKYAVYSGLLDQDRLYRETILPKARSTLEALKAAYTKGRADIVGLLRAELMLYTFEEAHVYVIAKANQTLADIQALVGSEL